MRKFAVVGSSGYVAQRHIQTILNLGHNVVATIDPVSSRAINHFKSVSEYARYCVSRNEYPDFLVICSPSYLHADHCKAGLLIGSNIVCEKPLAFNVSDLEQLKRYEKEFNRRIYPIMQLRYLDSIRNLRFEIHPNIPYDAAIRYLTPRNSEYLKTWKGDPSKSGGFVLKVGIRPLDLITEIFGRGGSLRYRSFSEDTVTGVIENSDRFSLYFKLSISQNYRPIREMRIWTPTRDLLVNLDQNWETLYLRAYTDILQGKGLTIEDVEPAISICQQIKGDL